MRLMNADKYCEFLNTYPLRKAQDNIMNFYRDALKHTFECEVEAIPIEWLHNIMKKQLIFAMNSEMEGSITVQDGVIHCVSGAIACQVVANVIELWEKENDNI